MSNKGATIKRFGGVQPHELRAEKQDEIVRMLRSGLIIPDVARRAGVAKSTVLKCARRHGISDYALGKPGRPADSYRRAKLVNMQLVSDVPNYRAQAAHQRWNDGLGGWL